VRLRLEAIRDSVDSVEWCKPRNEVLCVRECTTKLGIFSTISISVGYYFLFSNCKKKKHLKQWVAVASTYGVMLRWTRPRSPLRVPYEPPKLIYLSVDSA
jgi:hypothetical protein